MEDQEARRARLKAMREQADGAAQSAPSPHISTSRLSNPFEDSAPISEAQTPRFNYYSNPVAGFTKRKDRGPSGNPSFNHPESTWRPDFYPPQSPPPPLSLQTGGFGSPIPTFNPHPGYPPPSGLEPQHRYREGTWPLKRPNNGPGRGAGPNYGGRGSGPGRGGFGRNQNNQGRGRGGQGSNLQGRGGGQVSARDRPDLFFSKSMLEDPWRDL